MMTNGLCAGFRRFVVCACLFDSFSDRNDGLGKKKTFQHRCKYSIEKEQKE